MNMNDQNEPSLQLPGGGPGDERGQDFKPWEQRTAPGMGGGGGNLAQGPEPELPPRILRELQTHEMEEVLDDQTRLAHYPMVDRFTPAPANNSQKADENEEVWRLFISEQLYDTRRVTLERFHLFEWFPLSPGKFHTTEGKENRRRSAEAMFQTAQGAVYYNPYGKASMLRGGVGAVRLRPRLVAGEPHYFMTASSSGVCHEGFPVLVPRRFYGQLKRRMLAEGAAPVTLSGEMRYVMEDLPSLFEGQREIPTLYLHVDELSLVPEPRPGVTSYAISPALSFVGEFDGREGMYVTYCTFDPSSAHGLEEAINWLEKFYVTEVHKGVVVTDFDEVQPRFPGAVFGLPDLMAGKLDQAQVEAFLKANGMAAGAAAKYFLIYKEINTQGGAYIAGDVYTEGGDFAGRDLVKPGGG